MISKYKVTNSKPYASSEILSDAHAYTLTFSKENVFSSFLCSFDPKPHVHFSQLTEPEKNFELSHLRKAESDRNML